MRKFIPNCCQLVHAKISGTCTKPSAATKPRVATKPCRLWLRVFISSSPYTTFVLGLGARHGGIVKLLVVRCVTVFACFTYYLLLPAYTSDVTFSSAGRALRNTELLNLRGSHLSLKLAQYTALSLHLDSCCSAPFVFRCFSKQLFQRARVISAHSPVCLF